MKKITFFTLAFLFVSIFTQAQSFQLSMQDTTISASINESDIELHIKLLNNSSSNKSVKVKKVIIDAIPGSENNFCWGITCYLPSTYISTNPQSINAAQTDSTFKAIYTPYGNAGISKIKYRFFDVNNVSDSTSITITYDIQPASVKGFSTNNNTFNIYPNPASNFIKLNYSISNSDDTQLILHDILGSQIKKVNLEPTESFMSIPVHTISSGIYFYSIINKGEIVLTNKLVIVN